MRIQGLGVIDDAVLELSPGLTVVTGETGAGKTMVVTGLGLLFGDRADSGLVRAGTGRAHIEGRIVLDPGGDVAARALDAGAELDGDALLVSRMMAAEGRSRAYLGGRSVPVALLGGLADDLVALHGQSDQMRLLHPTRQRTALDRYAGDVVTGPLARYAETYARLQRVAGELEDIVTRARERAQEADLLRFGVGEIETAAPTPGEDAELAAEAERLGHADALRSAATGAHEGLVGDPAAGDGVDAVTLVGSSRRMLDQVRDHDPRLAEIADRLAEAGYLLSDVASDLASYADGIDADPVRLAAVEERRAVLGGLTRKYGESVNDVLAWAKLATQRLAELDDDDERIDRLRGERDDLLAELAGLAEVVSLARQEAAQRFGDAVTAELAGLAMPKARVIVAVRQSVLPEERSTEGLRVGDRVVGYGPHGVDDVEILLEPHPGAPARPIQKGASGGELSRVMLGVEVVFAGADPVPTFVFDEIDAGVGGKAAVEVGRRLARLARSAQVIVVTHLPQVAAFADRHLVVEKSDDGSVTRSGVRAVGAESRARELSRMLAGLEDSELGRAHAEELLAAARAAREGAGQAP
ncbi:MAG: DNA repair protein RecN [Carbonactinosporaceae bacterium]